MVRACLRELEGPRRRKKGTTVPPGQAPIGQRELETVTSRRSSFCRAFFHSFFSCTANSRDMNRIDNMSVARCNWPLKMYCKASEIVWASVNLSGDLMIDFVLRYTGKETRSRSRLL